MASFELSKTVPLPESVKYVIENGDFSEDSILAGFIFDTKLVWVAYEAHIDLLDVKTGKKIAEWTFGAVLKDTTTRIVCVKEIYSVYEEVTLLVIGLECMVTGGMVCIFDISSWKVLRAIQLKNKVTSLHILSSGDEITSFPGHLNNFDGALVVGTVGGDVFIIDMCRHAIDEACQSNGNLVIKNEIDPSQLIILSVSDVNQIERYKEVADRKGNHLAVHINEIIGANSPHFTLKGPKGEDRVHVNKQEVCVSALMYAPQLSSILVGFNFGALQIWNLLNMSLVYTSPVYKANIPVSHFAIQEPMDDPRAYCYFWAVYSSTKPYRKGFPIAALYSLCYESKDWHEGYGNIYQNLQSCAIRFQADLSMVDSDVCNEQPQGAQCLRLHSFNKRISKEVFNATLQENIEESYAICLMVWNVWCKNHNSHTYMSIFDLNQWYKEQMPSHGIPEHCKKYMFSSCLSDITTNRGPIFDAHINQSSISQFVGAQRLEEHYYPTSLAFECCAIGEAEIGLFKHVGSQRQFLRNIEQAGPLALMNPTQLYESSMQLGLTPIFVESFGLPTMSLQREYLLSLVLENGMKNWLCKCATSWGNGSHRSAGLSLELLLNWAWQRTNVLKTNTDRLCVCLFDYSEVNLDANASNLLNRCRNQIFILKELYSFVIKKCSQFLVNPDITNQQKDCLTRIFTYLDVQGWMINIGLLPESTFSVYGKGTKKIPYPAERLKDFYKERRITLHGVNQSKQLMMGNCYLYIDKIIELCGAPLLQKEWQQVGGTGEYPPSSLQALLRIYLLENIDMEQKHIILSYLFLDLAMVLDQNKYKAVISTLIKFPSIFQIPSSTIKIVHAFWQLDHSELETSVEQFIDPMIRTSQLKNWHHKFVLQLLMLEDNYKLAYLYLKVRQPPINDSEDVSLAISLHISNNMLHDAFSLCREHQQNEDKNLTRIIFRECLKQNQMNELLTYKMTKKEEDELFRFMDEIKFKEQYGFKSIYYLQRGRYLDFFSNHMNGAIKIPSEQGTVDCNVEMESVMDMLVPNISKKVINVCIKRQQEFNSDVSVPKPMSVFLLNREESAKYNSEFVGASIIKAKETWNSEMANTKQIGYQNIPFVRSLKSFPDKRVDRNLIYSDFVESFKNNKRHDEEELQPRKRIKLSLHESLHSPSEKGNNVEEDKLLELTKIKTPIIQRNTSVGDNCISQALEFSNTPQSILKVKSFTEPSMDVDRGNSTTPENLNEISQDNLQASPIDETCKLSFTFLNNQSSILDSTEKPIISGRKSIVRTPVVRFSGIQSSNTSTSTNQSLCATEFSTSTSLKGNDINESELPLQAGNCTTARASFESKNSSTDTFYSPDVSFENEKALEIIVMDESTAIEPTEEAVMAKHKQGCNQSTCFTESPDESIIKLENETEASPKLRVKMKSFQDTTIDFTGPRVTSNLQFPLSSQIINLRNVPIRKKLCGFGKSQTKNKDSDLTSDESLNSSQTCSGSSLILLDNSLDVTDSSINSNLYSPLVTKIIKLQDVPISKSTDDRSEAEKVKYNIEFDDTKPTQIRPKSRKSYKIGSQIDSSGDEKTEEVHQFTEHLNPEFSQCESRSPTPSTPKCRKSYKGIPQDSNNTTKSKLATESPKTKKVEVAKIPARRSSTRKSLTRQVLEHNTRSKLKSTIKSESSFSKTEKVEVSKGNEFEETVDKYEKYDVLVEKQDDSGVTKIVQEGTEESSKSTIRIVKKEGDITHDDTIFDEDTMDVNELSTARKEDKEQSVIAIVEELNDKIKNEQSDRKDVVEEDINIYDDLSSSSSTKYGVVDPKMNNFQVSEDLSYHEEIPIEQSMQNEKNLADEFSVTNYPQYQEEQEEFSSILISDHNKNIGSDFDFTSEENSSDNTQFDEELVEISNDSNTTDNSSNEIDVISINSTTTDSHLKTTDWNEERCSEMSFNADSSTECDMANSGSETDDLQLVDKSVQTDVDELEPRLELLDMKPKLDFDLHPLDKSYQVNLDIDEINEEVQEYHEKRNDVGENKLNENVKKNIETGEESNKMHVVSEDVTNMSKEVSNSDVKVVQKNLLEKVIEEVTNSPAKNTRSASMKSTEVTTSGKSSNRMTSIDNTVTTPKRTRRCRSNSDVSRKATVLPTNESPNNDASTSNIVSLPKKRGLRTKSVDAIMENVEAKKINKPRGRKASTALHPIEEDKKSSDIDARTKTEELHNYSSSRRLTRKQAELLEKNLTSATKINNKSEDNNYNREDMKTPDRILLLDKVEFQGVADPEEEKAQNSPVSSITGSSVTDSTIRNKRAPSSEPLVDSEISKPTRRTRQASRESPVLAAGVKKASSSNQPVVELAQLDISTLTPRRSRRVSQSSDVSDVSIGGTRRSTRKKSNSKSDSDADSKVSDKRGRKRGKALQTDLEKIAEESSCSQDAESKKAKRGRPKKTEN